MLQYIFKHLLLLQLPFWIQAELQHTKYCDWYGYHDSYARVYLTRRGHPVLPSLSSSGFLDLQSRYGLLCINGPAIIYRSVEDDDTFTNGEFKIYDHDCILFNRQGRETDETVTGVRLIAKEGDYRRPESAEHGWFLLPEFGHIEPQPESAAVVHSSFVFITAPTGQLAIGRGTPATPNTREIPPRTINVTGYSKSYCFSVPSKSKSINVTISLNVVAVEHNAYICTLTEPFANKQFADIFSMDLDKYEFEWYNCPWSGTFDKLKQTSSAASGSVTIDTSSLIDFRTINEKAIGGEGSKGIVPNEEHTRQGYPTKSPEVVLPHYMQDVHSGSCFHDEEGCKPDIPGEPPDSDSNEVAPSSNFTEITVSTDCQPAPHPVDSCYDMDHACNLVKYALTSEEAEWETKAHIVADAANDIDAQEAITPVTEMTAGAWRVEIFAVIESIFKIICSLHLPQHYICPGMSRVVQYYLQTIVQGNNQTLKDMFAQNAERNWESKLEDLKECLKTATPIRLLFDSSTQTKYVNLTNEDDEEPFVPVVEEYTEAAETDYDLNYAIDLHWRSVSTVVGYCNKDWKEDDPTYLESFYNWYTLDFMAILESKWMNTDDTDGDNEILLSFMNEKYEEILNHYLEAAFVLSDSAEQRYIRPLKLRDGKDNFFTTNPYLR